MIWLLILSCVAGVRCADFWRRDPQEPKIVGGDYECINNIPYQAQVISQGLHTCGASIISEIWLVSAAHCIVDLEDLAIRTGSGYRSKGEIHEIEKIVLPDKFDPKILDHDISLIMLKSPIRFKENQKPIVISQRRVRIGDNVTISGFGKEDDNDEEPSSILKIAYAPVVDRNVCSERYLPLVVTDNMFCAGDGQTDSCQGDSGGPAVVNNKLVGIVSWGLKCASNYHPGVYTEIYPYRKWIRRVTGINRNIFL